MQTIPHTIPDRHAALIAGICYVLIILLGLTSELLLRAPLIMPGDAAGTAARLAADPERLALSILADATMVVADVALAILLYILFRSVSGTLAAIASIFRLIQAAVIAAGLSQLWAAGHWAVQPGGEDAALAAMSIHAAQYDLGLIFFGVATLAMAALVRRHPAFPRVLAWLLGAAGLTYIVGSALRVMSADLYEAFQPAYLIAIIAETGFAVALLRHGMSGRPVQAVDGG